MTTTSTCVLHMLSHDALKRWWYWCSIWSYAVALVVVSLTWVTWRCLRYYIVKRRVTSINVSNIVINDVTLLSHVSSYSLIVTFIRYVHNKTFRIHFMLFTSWTTLHLLRCVDIIHFILRTHDDVISDRVVLWSLSFSLNDTHHSLTTNLIRNTLMIWFDINRVIFDNTWCYRFRRMRRTLLNLVRAVGGTKTSHNVFVLSYSWHVLRGLIVGKGWEEKV
jgi:hypothetical protein